MSLQRPGTRKQKHTQQIAFQREEPSPWEPGFVFHTHVRTHPPHLSGEAGLELLERLGLVWLQGSHEELVE